MNEILKIVANEGLEGVTYSYWTNSESGYAIDTFNQNSAFVYSEWYDFWILNPPYHYTNFYNLDSLTVWGFTALNLIDSWTSSPSVITTPSGSVMGASCIWDTAATGVEIILGSINNSGLNSAGSHRIEEYPNATSFNAGYLWYYASAGSSLESTPIAPSLKWYTGVSYDPQYEGNVLPSSNIERVTSDEFEFLPKAIGVFPITNYSPLLLGSNPTANTFTNYEKYSFSSRWLETHSYKAYNCYSTLVNLSNAVGSNVSLGDMRIAYPISAGDDSNLSHWKYKNNDFQHKWMGCDLTGNQINGLGLVTPSYLNSNLNYDLIQNFKSLDFYRTQGNYPSASGEVITNGYVPENDSYTSTGVYGNEANHLYAPTILSVEALTNEAQGSNLAFELEASFPPDTTRGVNNNTQVLTDAYINGTANVGGAPFTGEFTTNAISSQNVLNTVTSLPSGGSGLLGTGIWHKIHGSTVSDATNLSISNGNLRMSSNINGSGKLGITCLVKLKSSRSYRVFFKVSQNTPVGGNTQANYSVSLHNGFDAESPDNLIFRKGRNINDEATLTSSSSNVTDNYVDLGYSFDTPTIPSAMVGGLSTEGYYRLTITSKSLNADILFDFIRFASNVTGVVEESIDFIANKLSGNQLSIPQSIPSAINSKVKFCLDTSLTKGQEIPNSSIHEELSQFSSEINVPGAANGAGTIIAHYNSGSATGSMSGIPFTQTGLEVVSRLNVTNVNNLLWNYEGEDEYDAFVGGVLTLPSNPPYSYIRIQLSLRFECDNTLSGLTTTWRLKDQNGNVVNDFNGNPLSLDIVLPTGAGNYAELNLDSDIEDWTVNVFQPLDISGITQLYFDFDMPSTSSPNAYMSIRNSNETSFQFTPVMLYPNGDYGSFEPTTTGLASIIVNEDVEGFNKVSTRKTRGIEWGNSDGKYSFSPLDKIPKDSSGFYTSNPFTVSGSVKVVGEDLSLYADTLAYKDVGYTNVNAEIERLSFGTNQHSFITRQTEGEGYYNGLRYHWNPTDNEITKAPLIKVNLPTLMENTSLSLIGTTPTITFHFQNPFMVAGSTNIDSLVVWSGTAYHIIPPSSVGSYAIDDILLQTNDLYIKAGTFSNGVATDGNYGADVIINSITCSSVSETVGVYTLPDIGSLGGGVVVKSNVPNVVIPQDLTVSRYYVMARQDSSSPTGAFATTYTGNPPATSTDYDASAANSSLIIDWEESSVALTGYNNLPSDAQVYGDWELPSRDTMTLAVNAIGGSLFSASEYTPPAGYAGHWSSSTGAIDPTGSMYSANLLNGSIQESTYSTNLAVRMIRVHDSSENFEVNAAQFGGIIFKKEALGEQMKIVKIISDTNQPVNYGSGGLAVGMGGIGSALYGIISDPTEAQSAVANQLISGACSDLDGELNTGTLNSLFPTNDNSNPAEVAYEYSDGTYNDWYVPSNSEWTQIYTGLGVVEANLIDPALTLNQNTFLSSTIGALEQGGVLLFSGTIFATSGLNAGQSSGDGFLGFTNTTYNHLRLARTVTTNASLNIGDTFQGGKVFSITPTVVSSAPPAIEKWYSTASLMTGLGLSSNNWGNLTSVVFTIDVSFIAEGNSITLQSNWNSPALAAYQSPEGNVQNPYVFPNETVITTAGIHSITATQAIGTTNTSISSGFQVGFKMIFRNTSTTNNYGLSVGIASVSLSLGLETYHSSSSTDKRKEVILDLNKEETFSSTYSCKDFEFLSKSSSDFSKTIKVPATTPNKNAFGSLSNMKGGNDSSINSGVPINVYKGGCNIFEGLGFIQKSIYNDTAEVDNLEIVLRGGNATWFTALSNLKLQDISSLAVLERVNLGRVFGQSEVGESNILYPLVDTGRLKETDDGIPLYELSNLTPAYHIRFVFQEIFKAIGYTVDSHFLNLDGDFDGMEFDGEFSGLFNSYIAVSSLPNTSKESIDRSRVMLSAANINYRSRRAYQTNNGSIWAGNEPSVPQRLVYTPLIRAWGDVEFDSGYTQLNGYALDYRPIKFKKQSYNNENTTSEFQLNSGIYSQVGENHNIGNADISGYLFNQVPLSWSWDITATKITVNRSGYYDISSNSRVSFFRDNFITEGDSDINYDNNITYNNEADGKYYAGIGEFSKFTIALVAKNAEDEPTFVDSKGFAETLFNRSDSAVVEIAILENHPDKPMSCTQVQYLEAGTSYYPVAMLADKIHGSAYDWQNNLIEDHDDFLSGADLGYTSRHHFIMHECNLNVQLSETPIPIHNFGAYYNINSSPRLSVADLMPNVSTLEFVSEVSKLFNLIWTTNKKTRTIEVEPFNDFYDTNVSNAVDWTKKAYVVEQSINSILPKELSYKFVPDSSDKTLSFGGDSTVMFGDVDIKANPSSTKDSTVGLSIFSTGKMNMNRGLFNSINSPIKAVGVYCIRAFSSQLFTEYPTNHSKPDVLSSFKSKLATTKGRVSKLDFLSLSGLAVGASAYYATHFPPSSDSSTTILESINALNYLDTAYIYSGDGVSPVATFSNSDLSFTGSEDVNGGLYNKYHQGQVEMLKFSDRMTIAEANLTPADIDGLNFRKYIKIKNDYYILNKVLNYNPNDSSPTKLELVLTYPRGTQENL